MSRTKLDKRQRRVLEDGDDDGCSTCSSATRSRTDDDVTSLGRQRKKKKKKDTKKRHRPSSSQSSTDSSEERKLSDDDDDDDASSVDTAELTSRLRQGRHSGRYTSGRTATNGSAVEKADDSSSVDTEELTKRILHNRTNEKKKGQGSRKRRPVLDDSSSENESVHHDEGSPTAQGAVVPDSIHTGPTSSSSSNSGSRLSLSKAVGRSRTESTTKKRKKMSISASSDEESGFESDAFLDRRKEDDDDDASSVDTAELTRRILRSRPVTESNAAVINRESKKSDPPLEEQERPALAASATKEDRLRDRSPSPLSDWNDHDDDNDETSSVDTVILQQRILNRHDGTHDLRSDPSVQSRPTKESTQESDVPAEAAAPSETLPPPQDEFVLPDDDSSSSSSEEGVQDGRDACDGLPSCEKGLEREGESTSFSSNPCYTKALPPVPQNTGQPPGAPQTAVMEPSVSVKHLDNPSQKRGCCSYPPQRNTTCPPTAVSHRASAINTHDRGEVASEDDERLMDEAFGFTTEASSFGNPAAAAAAAARRITMSVGEPTKETPRQPQSYDVIDLCDDTSPTSATMSCGHRPHSTAMVRQGLSRSPKPSPRFLQEGPTNKQDDIEGFSDEDGAAFGFGRAASSNLVERQRRRSGIGTFSQYEQGHSNEGLHGRSRAPTQQEDEQGSVVYRGDGTWNHSYGHEQFVDAFEPMDSHLVQQPQDNHQAWATDGFQNRDANGGMLFHRHEHNAVAQPEYHSASAENGFGHSSIGPSSAGFSAWAERPRRVRDASASNPAFVRGAVKRPSSKTMAPRPANSNLGGHTQTSSIGGAVIHLGTDDATERNDLMGGSGVGAGSYELVRPAQLPRWTAQERPSSASTQKTSNKRNKGGGWKRKGRSNRGRGRGRGRTKGAGRGRGRGRGGGGWSAASTSWAGNTDDPNLSHIGGAEMSF